jgi:hypothetical protein
VVSLCLLAHYSPETAATAVEIDYHSVVEQSTDWAAIQTEDLEETTEKDPQMPKEEAWLPA